MQLKLCQDKNNALKLKSNLKITPKEKKKKYPPIHMKNSNHRSKKSSKEVSTT